MENLLALDKTACEHDILDLDGFLHQRMTPLIQHARSQLKYMDDIKQLQDYTRNKIQRAIYLIDTVDEYWKQLTFENATNQYNQRILQQFERALSDFSEKYQQLEQLQGDYFDDYTTLNNAMDSFMGCIEQMDTYIGDIIDTSSDIHDKVVHDKKISDLVDMDHEQMDYLTPAIAYGKVRLLDYDELPMPWRNNMHIHTGYRFLPTPGACFRSWLYLHNESGNIYTHFIGFLAYFCLAIYELFFSPLLSDGSVFDYVIVIVFFLAVCKCLICSTLWHTLSGINNYHLFMRAACLDYVGISALICASLMSAEYYGFYCDTLWRNTYLIGTGSLALIGTTMPLMSWFDRPESQWIRIVFFSAIASSGFIPIFHMLYIESPSRVITWMAPIFKSILCYIIGAIIYSNQIPERFWPGKFDYFGHSHQWWHVLACAGIWWHYAAATNFVPHRYEFGTCVL